MFIQTGGKVISSYTLSTLIMYHLIGFFLADINTLWHYGLCIFFTITHSSYINRVYKSE